MSTWIQTRSRRRLDLLNPSPEQVDWSDVALGLARTARFSGQTSRRYSVAEHSIRVALAVPENARLGALLHDAHEAYLGDWTSPLQRALMVRCPGAAQALQYTQQRVQATILTSLWRCLGHPGKNEAHWAFWNFQNAPVSGPVMHADLTLLATEARDLLPGGPLDEWTRDLPPPLEGVDLSRIGTFFSLGMRVDTEQPIASAWLSAVERSAGLEVGALVPLAGGACYMWHGDDATTDGTPFWLGCPIPKRRWSGPVNAEEVPGGDRR